MALEMVLIERIWMELLETANMPCFIMDEQGQLIEGNDALKILIECPSWQTIEPYNVFEKLGIDDNNLKHIRDKLDKGILSQHIQIRHKGKNRRMHFICREMQVQVYDSMMYYGMLIDETEKVELQQKWSRAKKTVALGQLTGEIIHDFNNLTNIIQNCAELIHREIDDNGHIYNDLQAIRLAAQKASQLSQKLLTYIKEGHESQSTVFSVNDKIRELLGIYNAFLQNHFTIEYQLNAEEDRVQGDPALLDQAIMNLLINAKEAMPDGGIITIITKNVNMIEALPHKKSLKICPNNYICIQIRDTGPGIPQELKKNIFQPLFTTKQKGTGLGLSIVEDNIHKLNGRISVYSRRKQGSTFNILIPFYKK
ncbi:hypothetical protein JW835_02605 [bacterium]|nr:hypothetical protein [bacterium]